MRKVVGIVYTDIVAEVAADDGAVVKADGSAEVVKFQVVRIEPADTHQSEELTVLYELGCKGVGYEYVIPVGGGVAIAHEHFYLVGCQLAVASVLALLEIAKIVFVLVFGKIAAIDEVIA